jgi:hypothetical protein
MYDVRPPSCLDVGPRSGVKSSVGLMAALEGTFYYYLGDAMGNRDVRRPAPADRAGRDDDGRQGARSILARIQGIMKPVSQGERKAPEAA